MSDNTANNMVTISGCNFLKNRAIFAKNGKYTGGGGIHIVITIHHWDDNVNTNKNKIEIMDSSFKYNEALEGGAICFAIARQNSASTDQLTGIFVLNTSFEHNLGRMGSAIMVINFPLFNEGSSAEVEFCDCSFSNNILKAITESPHPAGIAAVYVREIRTSFLNNIAFYNNTGSALLVVGTQVNFKGSTAIFSNNSGLDGGAIALLGVATILIGPNTNMTFMNNTANRYGGAIYNRYISNEDLTSNADCFLRYSEPFLDPPSWKVQFIFSGNNAYQDGCSIFSTSIYPCLWSDNSEIKLSQVFRWNEQWAYENPVAGQCDEICTEPTYFNQSSSGMIKVHPGFTFNLPLEAWDDFDHNVTSDVVYSASMQDSSDLKPSLKAEIDPGYTYITSNYIRITGEPESNVTLELQSEGSRKINILLNLTILKCPPGFAQIQRTQFNTQSGTTRKRFKCECLPENRQYRGHLKCSSNRKSSKIDIKYWYGPVEISGKSGEDTITYLMGITPFAYRATSQLTVRNKYLPMHLDETERFICGHTNRRGILCGQCLEGYAVAVNSLSYECVPCGSNATTAKEFTKHLFIYIALTYIPTVIIFIAIIVFDVKLASSAAAGCLLFAQTISSGYFDVTAYNTLDIHAHGSAPKAAQAIYTTIYGISNLKSFAFLIHPFCLKKSFTTLHVLCLEYATAVFPLMVIATICLVYRYKSLLFKCNCCRWCRKKEAVNLANRVVSSEQLMMPRNTLIHAFTAFLLLSYNKFSLASIRTIIISELFDEAGVSRYSRVYLAGHLSLSDRDFLIPFGMIAILVLIFIVLLPPLLLLGPLHFMDWLSDKSKFSFIRKCWPSIKIHTILDTFQGYKPNRRFFVGLYLLFRLIMFLTFSLSIDFLTQNAVQQITIFIFTLIVSLLKPYTNDFYNYLDTVLFLNLGILNALAIYTIEGRFSAAVFTLQCILVFLPLIYLIIYVTWNILNKRKCYNKSSAATKFIKSISHLFSPVIPSAPSQNPVKLVKLEQYGQLKNENDDITPSLFHDSVYYFSDDPDEVTFQRALNTNRYQPPATVSANPPQ